MTDKLGIVVVVGSLVAAPVLGLAAAVYTGNGWWFLAPLIGSIIILMAG